jgi:thymidylate synthase
MNIELINKFKELLLNNQIIDSVFWQSVEIDKRNPIVSVFDINGLLEVKPELFVNEMEPDLPWAENHFMERINGQPINPGIEYKNWPYYREKSDDILFRSNGKFSHNYMERIWCKGYKGIRYEYGDLNDIIDKLKLDIYTRQAFLSIWHPEDQSLQNERIPCTIGYWFYFKNNRMNIKFLIRSCDAIRHYKNDLYMSYRLLEHVCNKLNVDIGSLSYWIGSFHCFKTDLYTLNKIIKNN